MTLSYEDFLAAKVDFDRDHGFDVDEADVHTALFPHQRDIVQWAVRGGRRAVFARFGLGKSVIQLETLRITLDQIYSDPPPQGLIVCPLGVRQEFIRDAHMLGLDVAFVRRDEEMDQALTEGRHPTSGIWLTNYESIRDGRLDPKRFDAVSLDEASVLRSFGSKTYQTFLTLFDAVPYRFVATATPSPNRLKELIHYAGFLGVMDTGEALTRWFQRDSTKANNLRLYPHKEREFWLWVNTWACFVQRPSDLGHCDDGYDLPPIDVRWHEVEGDPDREIMDRDGQFAIVNEASLGVSEASREKRASMAARVALTAELVDQDPEAHFILWHDLEDERRALKAAIPEAVEVYGSLDLDERETRIIDFSNGRHRILATKPILSGSGCNFQRHCHRAIFTGVSFKFNDFVQAIHRLHRFQQDRPVRIDIIHGEAERDVVRQLKAKWTHHEELTDRMSTIVREFGLSRDAIDEALRRSLGVDRVAISSDHEPGEQPRWTLANNDCIPEIRDHVATDSVGLIVTSIPFANHYEYTPAYEDLGHTNDNAHFWAQMDYLTPELLRVLAPGRVYACHVKDRINFGNVTGAGVPTVSPFHVEAIQHAIGHGFDYLGMITVVTDVVRENNQTYRLSYSEMLKDGTKMGVGSPEYILLFHKPQTDRTKGYADQPVRKDRSSYSLARWQFDAAAFWRSSGDRPLAAAELVDLPVDQRQRLFTQRSLENVYDHELAIQVGEELDGRGVLPRTFAGLALGSPDPQVWHDVNRMHTLNGEQVRRNVQMHVCPLQLDIVERLIDRYSGPGDLVLDPFSGLGTVPLVAVRRARRGRGAELNAGYFADSVGYLRAEDLAASVPSLFDLLDAEAGMA